jgi:hypothetical protein
MSHKNIKNTNSSTIQDGEIDKLSQKELDHILSLRDVNAYLDYFNKNGYKILNPGKKEPIISFICRLNIYHFIMFILFILMLPLIPVNIAIYEKVFININLKLDMFHDFQYFILFSIGTPFLVLLIYQYFRFLPKVLLELCISGVVSISKERYNQYIENEAEIIYNRKLVTWPPYIIAIIIALITILFFVLGPMNSWQNPNNSWGSISGWLNILHVFILYYLIAMILCRIVATFIVLNNFFSIKNKENKSVLVVQPFHPDGRGGLYPLGKLCVKLNIGVFVFGLITMSAILMNYLYWIKGDLCHPINILILIGYILGATVAFFFPLYSTHNKMRLAKDISIRNINQRYRVLNNSLEHSIINNDLLDKRYKDEIDILDKMYTTAKLMPVYPFNFEILFSFFSSVMIPTILPLLIKITWLKEGLPKLFDWLQKLI